eukprot:5463676-Amphidinium_carterae.1
MERARVCPSTSRHYLANTVKHIQRHKRASARVRECACARVRVRACVSWGTVFVDLWDFGG